MGSRDVTGPEQENLNDGKSRPAGLASAGLARRRSIHEAGAPAMIALDHGSDLSLPASAEVLILPLWRSLLESRWQRRLDTVIRLSLAYHDTANGSGGHRAGDQAESPQLRQLLRAAVAARRALSDTEDALTRLSAGTYGRCEQCGTAIPVALLVAEPEARFCQRCLQQSPGDDALMRAVDSTAGAPACRRKPPIGQVG
jgi:RNA polymerase-binding transcription factor DksA